MEETPNHDLNMFDLGETGWTHSPDMAHIEERLTIADYKTQLEEYEPYEKCLFLAMDSDEVYEGTGSEWVLIDWEVGDLVAQYIDAATLRVDGNDVASENWVEESATVDASTLSGLTRDEFAYNQRTWSIQSEGSTEYHKIGELDSADTKMYVRCDFTNGINVTGTESWDAYVHLDDGVLGVEWRKWGEYDDNRVHLYITEDTDEHHVYLRTNSWSRTRVLTTNTAGVTYTMDENVTSLDGSEVYTMDGEDPNMRMQFGEIYSQGERVATRDWVNSQEFSSIEVSYDQLTDVPSEFTPEEHGNTSHNRNYVDAQGARNAVDGSDVSVEKWGGYEVVFDDETPTGDQYIRFVTQ